MKCIMCGHEYIDKKYFPFCCKRCKLVDLYNWLDEKYFIPVENIVEDEAEE